VKKLTVLEDLIQEEPRRDYNVSSMQIALVDDQKEEKFKTTESV